MEMTKTFAANDKAVLPAAMLTSVIITFFLFYIDEGYYDFRWMQNIGNWIVFVVYAGAMITCQVLASYLLFSRKKGWKRPLYASLAGIPAGLTLVIGFFLLRM